MTPVASILAEQQLDDHARWAGRIEAIVGESLDDLGIAVEGRRAFVKPNVVSANRRYIHDSYTNPAVVEATVGALKRPFSNDQVPVRGLFRVGALMLGSALMINVRRIQRYYIAKVQATVSSKAAKREESTSNSTPTSFLLLLRNRLRRAGTGYSAFWPIW